MRNITRRDAVAGAAGIAFLQSSTVFGIPPFGPWSWGWRGRSCRSPRPCFVRTRRPKKGVLQCIWATLVENCEELGGVDWQWQSADGAMGKARFGGTMSVQIPRIVGKMAPSAV